MPFVPYWRDDDDYGKFGTWEIYVKSNKLLQGVFKLFLISLWFILHVST